MPGICFNGIQKISTIKLIKNVDPPILKLVTLLTPSARTVHGLTPIPAAINIASPRPNRAKPNTKNINVINRGLKFRGLGELQNKAGILLTDKNRNLGNA
jgi:hypothetical protein